MKAMRVSDGIVPIGEFKAQAARWLRRLADSNQAVVITQNGRPAGVLISPADFDRFQERQRFLESVAAGVTDAESGRLMDTRELSRKLAEARRSRRAR
ncbi:MAG TPA: type II toxin-antitoxin system Phd/YefM family antitoxin [Vicinamibacteria bacterium]